MPGDAEGGAGYPGSLDQRRGPSLRGAARALARGARAAVGAPRRIRRGRRDGASGGGGPALASMTAASMFEPQSEYGGAAANDEPAWPQLGPWLQQLVLPAPRGAGDAGGAAAAPQLDLLGGLSAWAGAALAAAAPGAVAPAAPERAAPPPARAAPAAAAGPAAAAAALPLTLPGGGGGGGEEHSLVAVGTRHWLMNKVRIYDFAVYADARGARAALAGAFAAAAAGGGAEAAAAAGGAADAAVAAGWWQPAAPGWWPQAAAGEAGQEGAPLGADRAHSQQQQQQQPEVAAPRGRFRRRRAASPAAPRAAPPAPAAAAAGLPAALKADGSCGVSLLLRAARDIPLSQLRDEYSKILRRRLGRVGGDPGDPALPQLLDSFTDAARLPPAALAGGGAAVAKGAAIVFTRRGAVLEARFGDHTLGSVTSAHLGEALFDLYLGDTPVSEKAKAGAADTLARIVGGAEAHGAAAPEAASGGGGAARVYYSPRGGERVVCSGGGGDDARGCVVELR
ncbi:MAG: hypothetical protein J3K34DRAFT_521097 [Monoraphidium minutum]|nr:MAG: hypothetical protein J3K34DRAFT_521097 [Monoraphidium minutum]